MKTIKTFTAAILVLIGAVTFAQGEKGLFLTVKYSEELNRFETWVSNLQDRFNRNSEEKAIWPVVTETYYASYADISYEDGFFLEDWMINPFEDVLYENEVQMETWMTSPFDEEVDLEILPMEEWMSVPFDRNEGEEELNLEAWMAQPFETEGQIEMEDWMTAALWE